MDKTDNSIAATKAISDMTIAVTRLATVSDLRQNQMSGDIAEIKTDIKEIKTNSVTRQEFVTFLSTEFKDVKDKVQISADKKEVERINGLIYKVAGFIIFAVLAAILGLVLIPNK